MAVSHKVHCNTAPEVLKKVAKAQKQKLHINKQKVKKLINLLAKTGNPNQKKRLSKN